MTSKEANPAIRALRKGGINVLTVHNQMLDEEPRIFFLRYWRTGSSEALASSSRTSTRFSATELLLVVSR